MWARLDDGWWKHPKLRALPRSARGLLADVLSQCGDLRTDGFVGVVAMPMLGTSLTDPDLKLLVKAGMLHRKGDTCRCMDRRAWAWPTARGVLVHDFLDYSPSREENDVAKAKRAELRDPALRLELRDRDFGRCRYCAQPTNPQDRRWDLGETLDHIDPSFAAGADNMVVACRACNNAKNKRTPAQAGMTLLNVADVRAAHFADLGIADPDQVSTPEMVVLDAVSGISQDGTSDGPGRVGSGSGRVVGPPTTKRDSSTPNPYLKSAHTDPSLDPPPPAAENNELTRAPPQRPVTRSRRPSKRKGRR